MGKIMRNLKHNYNVFLELKKTQTMRHLVISTNFQWMPLEIAHFKKLRYNSRTIRDEEKGTKRYLPLSFSKYNETSQKFVYS